MVISCAEIDKESQMKMRTKTYFFIVNLKRYPQFLLKRKLKAHIF